MLKQAEDMRMGKYTFCNLHWSEIEPDLVSVCKGLNIGTQVGFDFLTYFPSLSYDLIIMNPPFENFEDHILHAWEILKSGELAAIIPLEGIRNDYSTKRKIISGLMQQYGTFEEVDGSPFEDAERKTKVRVGILRIKKPMCDPLLNLFSDIKVNTSSVNIPDDLAGFNPLVPYEPIANLVATHNAVLKYGGEAFAAMVKFGMAIQSLSGSEFGGDRSVEIIKEAMGRRNKDDRTPSYNYIAQAVQAMGWNKAHSIYSRSKYFTKSVKTELEEYKKTISNYAFTEDVIRQVIYSFRSSGEQIAEKSITELFNLFRYYHYRATSFEEGWKTNKKFRVNQKVIIPYGVTSIYSTGYHVGYGASEVLDDIDRTLCMISGDKFEDLLETETTIVKAIDLAMKHRTYDELSKELRSHFFKIRVYKKGTSHLTFLDKQVWQQLNILGARGHEREVGN